jgi:hypothetical protein
VAVSRRLCVLRDKPCVQRGFRAENAVRLTDRLRNRADGSSCPSTPPEDIHGAVRTPLLDGQGGLVPKARALSHYSGEPSWKRADYSNLNRCPDRMPVCGPGSGRNRRRAAGVYAPQSPAIPIAPLYHTAEGATRSYTGLAAIRTMHYPPSVGSWFLNQASACSKCCGSKSGQYSSLT